MAADQKARWQKEIDWLLSVADHIVEFVPSQQMSDNGTCMEVEIPPFQCPATRSQFNYPVNGLELPFLPVKQIMVTQQRQDLQMNIPALRKLDGMLLVSMGLLILKLNQFTRISEVLTFGIAYFCRATGIS